jgi:hypothetical protein
LLRRFDAKIRKTGLPSLPFGGFNHLNRGRDLRRIDRAPIQ